MKTHESLFTYILPGVVLGSSITAFIFLHNIAAIMWNTLPIIIGLILFVIGLIWLVWSVTKPYETVDDKYGYPQTNRTYKRKNEIYSMSFVIAGAMWFVTAWYVAHPPTPSAYIKIDDSTSCLHRGGVIDHGMRPVDGKNYSYSWALCKDGFSFEIE